MKQWSDVTTVDEYKHGLKVELCRDTNEYRHRRVKDEDGRPFEFDIVKGKPHSYKQLEERRQVSALKAITSVIWTVLKASAIPLSAAIVAHWYTGSDA